MSKLCTGCRHFRPTILGATHGRILQAWDDFALCAAGPRSLVTGFPTETCVAMRGAAARPFCGPDALLFEAPPPKPRSFWERLFRFGG